MPPIDPTLLSGIFKTLSPTEAIKPHAKQNKKAADHAPTASIELKGATERSKGELKKQLRYRLKKHKAEDKNFTVNAPAIAIKEILIWEFGEEILEHPEFKYFSELVLKELAANKELAAYINNLVESYSR